MGELSGKMRDGFIALSYSGRDMGLTENSSCIGRVKWEISPKHWESI